MTQKPKTYPAKPRWLKVFFDIWENRARTILVIASIAVGVFAVGMIITAYTVLANDMASSYSSANPAHIEIITESFDDDFVKIIGKLDGVSGAEGRHRASLRISQDGGQTWRGLNVFAVDDFEESSIFLRQPLEGKHIPDEREIVLDSRILDEIDIAVGDQLLIQLPNGTLREVPLVGFVRDQSVRGGPTAPAVAYINFDTLIWLGQDPSFNQLLVTVTGDGNDIDNINEVTARVEDRVERNGLRLITSVNNKTDEHPASTTVLTMLSVMGVMGVLMLLLGSSLIANTLNALLTQQMRQIGVMKLVGARNFQIVGMYLVLIMALGLLSLFIAVPLAARAGNAFAGFFGDLLSIEIGEIRFVPLAIVVQVLIAIIVPLLAGVVPVMNGSRRTVEEAISDNDMGARQEGWFDRLGETVDWVSRPFLISLRNTFRNMRRLMLTLFTLTVAGGIFIGVFNVQASLFNFIGNVTNLFIADVSIDLARPYRTAEMESRVQSILPGVEVEGWLSAVGEVTKADGSEVLFGIQAPPADSELVIPNMKHGRFLQPGDENALVVAESVWTELPDLQVGDTLQLGINGEREEPWTVVGIYAFPRPDNETVFAYAAYDTIAEQTNRPGLATVIKVVTPEHDIVNQRRYSEILDAGLQAQGIRINNLEVGKATSEAISEAISTLITLFLIMATLTAVVGSIGLAGTMSMNVMERIREIGILRAIGAVDSAVTSSVLVEGIFVGILSWLMGIVLSFPISYGLVTMVSLALTNSVMPVHFSPTGFWLWLLVILVLSTLASILPARSAARLTIREVLAYE
ncbi:MAG: FtsX-like permease family protein [Chloroflexota bacterium]